MRPLFQLVPLLALALCSLPGLSAQDLSPRAYVITPLHSNALTLTYGFYDGGLVLTGPISNATGTYSVPVISFYHSFRMFGHSANIVAALPYAIGTFQGDIGEQSRQIHRSGLLDTTYRLSVNLKGGPPMELPKFVKWKQKTLIGVSLKVVAPTGQYDPAKLINWGQNRWAFYPELGYSKRWNKTLLDVYGGVWFFTPNPRFFTGNTRHTERPVGSFEGHLSYDWKRGTWVSLDGNYWFGRTVSNNGILNPKTRQSSSRIGGTGAIRFTTHQSIKLSYSAGAFARFGGNYQNVSVAWQYSWLGHPK